MELPAFNRGVGWQFQHDNVSVHVSRLAKTWFSEKNVDVIDWLAKSSDLNPVENLQGILARAVYSSGK